MTKIKDFLKREFILVSVCLVIGWMIRYFIYSSQNFLMNVDSYYYVTKIKDGVYTFKFIDYLGHLFGVEGLIHILMLITILSIPLFYYTCRQYTGFKGAFIGTIGYALSPLVFFNNQFGILDKNIPSLFMIILIVGLFGRYKGLSRIISLVFSLGIFYFIWDGWIGILGLIIVSYLVEMLIDKKYKILLPFIIVSPVLGYFAFNRFLQLVKDMNIRFISELNPIWNIGFFWEYIIIGIIWILVFTKIKLEKYDSDKIKKYLFLYTSFIITFFAMCFVFRMNIFFLPFLYIWFAIIFDDLEYNWIRKFTFFGILILIIVSFSFNMYQREPVMNQDILNAMDYVNNINDSNCIISNWDMGVIYDAYTDKHVAHRASASGFETEINELVYGSNESCIIIWDNHTINVLNYQLIYLGEDINISDYYIKIYENESIIFGDTRVLYRR